MYILCEKNVHCKIVSLSGLVKIGPGRGTIWGSQTTITRIMRSKTSTYIHGFTTMKFQLDDSKSIQIYSKKMVVSPKIDWKQITFELPGTLPFSVSVDLLRRSASRNCLHGRWRKKRKRKKWISTSLDELATFCATFSTPGIKARWKPKTEKKLDGRGSSWKDSQIHTWKIMVSGSVVQMVLLIFCWICLVTSISLLQKVLENHWKGAVGNPCLPLIWQIGESHELWRQDSLETETFLCLTSANG